MGQAVYRSLLHLTWVDKLVDNIKTIFISLYGEQLKKPNTTIVECAKFDEYFEQQLQELDKSGAAAAATAVAASSPRAGPVSIAEDGIDALPPGAGPPLAPPGLTYRGRAINNNGGATHASSDAAGTTSPEELTPAQTPNTSRPSTPGSNLVVAKAGPAAKLSRRAKKAKNGSTAPSSGDESGARGKKAAAAGSKAPKKGRKWDADGYADEDDDVQLDYSAQAAPGGTDSETETAAARSTAVEQVDASTWGSTTKGKFILKDLGDEVHDILASAQADQAANSKKETSSGGLLGTGINAVSGLFRNVVGGKTLTKEDLDKAMKGMEEHLLRKNVAREAAVRLCEGVEKELLGVKTGNFESESPPSHPLSTQIITRS